MKILRAAGALVGGIIAWSKPSAGEGAGGTAKFSRSRTGPDEPRSLMW
ncbi:MAG TPA: hypothetical protein VFC46_04425 [Humisphaera sp.]|nr:hypothetical protein [Humisphaera sp.]